MVAKQPRLEKFRRPEPKHLEDFGVLPRRALVVIHFDNNARKAITAEADYHGIVARINRLKMEYSQPSLVIGVHQIREEAAEPGGYDLLGPEDIHSAQRGRLVPKGLDSAPHEEVFAARSAPAGLRERPPQYPRGYLELVEQKVIPYLKKRHVGSILLSGAQMHACQWRFAEMAAANGIEAEIDAGSSVKLFRRPTHNPSRASAILEGLKRKLGPLGLFTELRPEYLEMFRNGLVDEDFLQGEEGKRLRFSVSPEGQYRVVSISPAEGTREIAYIIDKQGRRVFASGR